LEGKPIDGFDWAVSFGEFVGLEYRHNVLF